MRKLILLTFFSFCVQIALAGNGPKVATSKAPMNIKKTNARPDVPGTLIIDFGYNLLQNNKTDLGLRLLGSRTVNFYYLYDIRIAKSKFFLLPGIGVGLDRFKFDEDVTPTKTVDSDGNNTTLFVPISGGGVKKTMLTTNFIDIPVELRFYGNPEDSKRSFKAGMGFKVGYLLDAHTKIKQDLDGDVTKYKIHSDFNLNKLRYGWTARVGVGGFNVFYYQSLNTLFQSGKGPGRTNMNNATIGLSFTGF